MIVTVMCFEATYYFGACADAHEGFRVPYVDDDVHADLVVFAVV